MSGYTYAGQYGPQLITISQGFVPKVQAGLPVTVYLTGTQTPATLYTSRTKAQTASNPTTTDAEGNLTFFADPGRYDIVYKSTTISVVVATDPAEASATFAPLASARPLLFVAPGTAGAEIWAARSDGSGAVQVTNDPNYQSWWPRWAPDGKRLLFLRQPISQTNYDDPTQFAHSSLWIMNLDGTPTQLVAAGALGGGPAGQLFTPNWHPNGRDIVVAGGTGSTLLYRLRDDGTGITNIPITGVATGVADPTVSPDGSTVAFTYAQDIWTCAIGGGAKTQITTNGSTTQHYDPTWSPDGAALVFETKKSAGGGAIGQWAVEICAVSAGAAITTISDVTNVYGRPNWGADGQIYVHGLNYTNDAHFNVYRLRADGATASVRLTDDSARKDYPDIFVPRVAMPIWRGSGVNGLISGFNFTVGQLLSLGVVGGLAGLGTGNGAAFGPVIWGGSGAPGAIGGAGDVYVRADAPTVPNLRHYTKTAGGWVTDTPIASSTLALQTVSNSTSETVLATYTIPANTMYAGAVNRIRAAGQLDNQATSGSITFRLRHGGLAGTTLSTVVIGSISGAQTNQPWFIDGDLVALTIGATGTLVLGGHMRWSGSTAGTQAFPTPASPVVTVDTTASKDFVLTVQFATQSVSNVCRQYYATYEAE